MFSTLPRTNFNFSVTFDLSSPNAFNLDQSIILLFDKELWIHNYVITYLASCTTDYHNSLPHDKILAWSNLKEFADNKIKLDQMKKFVLDWLGNIVGTGENASYQSWLYGNVLNIFLPALTLSQTSPGFYVSTALVFRKQCGNEQLSISHSVFFPFE